jgi:prepilin-type N-terminal cleavage/methylation domain-containing protein
MSKSPTILTCGIRRRARLGESGMSLLELMIAMTVLTVGMLGSMVMILTAMESNSRNKTDNLATILDQEVMEKFATLNNYPKALTATIYDCALTGGNADSHLVSLGQGTYASGGNGAALYTSSTVPAGYNVGDIDWSQATPTLATSTTSGYAMLYRTCSGDNYEVRWNIMDANNPAPVAPAVSRISLLTVSARQTAAKGSPLGMLYAPPTTLRTLIESSQF